MRTNMYLTLLLIPTINYNGNSKSNKQMNFITQVLQDLVSNCKVLMSYIILCKVLINKPKEGELIYPIKA